MRYTPFLLKFVTFDSMPLGMTLQLGLGCAVVALVRSPRRQEMLLLGAGLVAMAALYPNLFPAAAALGLAATAVLAWKSRRDEGLASPAVDVAGWTAAGLIAGYFIIEGYGEGRTGSPIAMTPLAGLARKCVSAAVGLGPFALGAWWHWRLRPERRPELAALMAGAAGALACNLFLRLGGLDEYKLYVAAGLLLIPPALVGLTIRFPALGRRVGLITACSIAALFAVMASYARNRLPQQTAPPVDERSFFLTTEARNPDGRWMAAVRVKCDADTVLVVNRPELHVTAFTARRLLVGCERGGPHAGCNQPTRFNLVDLRGYDPATVDRRLELLDRVYRPEARGGREDNATLLEEIAAEAGPTLAFVFLPGDDRSFLDWLVDERHARIVYDDGARTVVEP